MRGFEAGPRAGARRETEQQGGGGVHGLAVSGDQDALPFVPSYQPGESCPRAGKVMVPGLRAGGVWPVGIRLCGSAECRLDLIPRTPVGLAVVRAAQYRLDVHWESERLGQDLR